MTQVTQRIRTQKHSSLRPLPTVGPSPSSSVLRGEDCQFLSPAGAVSAAPPSPGAARATSCGSQPAVRQRGESAYFTHGHVHTTSGLTHTHVQVGHECVFHMFLQDLKQLRMHSLCCLIHLELPGSLLQCMIPTHIV